MSGTPMTCSLCVGATRTLILIHGPTPLVRPGHAVDATPR